MNFAEVLQRSARLDPGRTVLLHAGSRVDYLAVHMAARRIATILARHHGIVPGDRVAVLLPDTPELAFATYGILWAGAVICALDPDTDPDELADALTTAGAKLLIGWHALAEAVEQGADALHIDWLLVEPREFSRLLAATPRTLRWPTSPAMRRRSCWNRRPRSRSGTRIWPSARTRRLVRCGWSRAPCSPRRRRCLTL